MVSQASPHRLSRIGHFDLETGEVMEHATMAVILRRSRNGFGKRWFAMAQDPAAFIARERKTLGGEGLAVYLVLLSVLDYENEIVITLADIGKELDMRVQAVSRAMRRLKQLGVIAEGPKLGSMKSYRLDPSYAWKGKGTNHVKALLGA